MAIRRPVVSIPEDTAGPPTTALAVIPVGDVLPVDVIPPGIMHPDHNDLNGLDGTGPEFNHLNDAELATLDPLINAGAFGANQVIFFDGTVFASSANFTFDAVAALLTILGTFDVVHTATLADDHALELDVNAAGFGDVKAIDIAYITGAIGGTDEEAVILANIDPSASTGGSVAGLEVLVTPGLADVFGLFAGIDVNPIEQLSGSFGDMDSALVLAVDRLTEFTTPGVDIQMFVADNDTITIGDAAKFSEIAFLLAITASGGGIQPTFEFSTGVGTWAAFTPVDGTNGMQNNGIVAWLETDIPSWAVGTGGEFLIRITRTRNTLTTPPTESLVQIAGGTIYSWDKNGDLVVRDISARDIVVSGLIDGVDLAAHVADGTIHFTEASIDHTAIQNIGTNSHAAIDAHIADGTIHFTEASIDHTAIANIGTNSHAAIDTHIADATIHFTEGSIDHDNLNAGASPPVAAHVPAGGTANQVLEKIDGTDYNTQWVTPSGGATFALAALQARKDDALAIGTVWADIPLNNTDIENEAATIEHNNTNTDDIDFKVAGLYKVTYTVNITHTGAANTNLLLQSRMRLNDTSVIAGSFQESTEFDDNSIEGSDVETVLPQTFIFSAAVNDKITLQLQYVDIGASGTPGLDTDEIVITVEQLFRP